MSDMPAGTNSNAIEQRVAPSRRTALCRQTRRGSAAYRRLGRRGPLRSASAPRRSSRSCIERQQDSRPTTTNSPKLPAQPAHHRPQANGCSTTTTSSKQQVILVREDLPGGYGMELPRLTEGPYRDFPRLYSALLTLLAHTDSRLDEEYLLRFVSGYQEISPLTIGEVWAVPIMLRIGLVENLRRLSRAAVSSLRAELAADEWAERLAAGNQGRRRRSAIDFSAVSTSETRGMPPAFFARVRPQAWARWSTAATQSTRGSNGASRQKNIVLEDAAVQAQQEQAADQVSIANSITSIRFLDALDWREFFERVSVAEDVLAQRSRRRRTRSWTSAAATDTGTHSRLLARRSEPARSTSHRRAVVLAREALARDASDQVRGHVGWWLAAARALRARARDLYRPLARRVGLPHPAAAEGTRVRDVARSC